MAQDLQYVLQQAQQQRAAEQQMEQHLRNTLQQPHTIEHLNVAAAALREDNGQVVLLIATPDGRRRDVPISVQTLEQFSVAHQRLTSRERERAA